MADYISRALVADALTEWRELLRARSSVSPLRDMATTDVPLIDLAGAHPSGLAPLFAGRATLLSTLVRDDDAYRAASHRGRLIVAEAEATMATTGVWTAALVVGTVETDGVERPLLLRPVTLERARHDDLTITLRHEVYLNPVFGALVRDAGGPADLATRAPRTLDGKEFDPRPVWNEVRSLGELLPGIQVHERLLLGAFDDAEQRLLDDLDDLDPVIGASHVIAAIAGDADAATILSEPLPPWGLGDRDPFGERGLGDLDDAAFRAIDFVALGRDLAIDAAPGSDAAGVVAAIAADAAASGRTALVVGGSDDVLAAVDRALADAGAADVAITGVAEQWHADARARLLASLTLDTPRVEEEELRIVGEGLLRARDDVGARHEALHRPRRPWGASAFEAVQAIVRLTASTPAPGTAIRLSQEAGQAVAEHGLAHVASAVVALLHGSEVSVPSRLAEPEPEPEAPTAWWSRVADSPEHGDALDEALATVVRLLPSVRSDARAAAAETGLDEAVSLATWRDHVALFMDVRVTLDTFSPAVFHRSLADLVEATAPRGEDAESTMKRSTRRALARRAAELMRPGRDRSTLHTRLAAAAREAERWRDRCSAGGWPVVPDDFAGYAARLARLDEAWAVLQPVLASAAGLDEPDTMPLADLEPALHDLADGIPGGLERAPAAPAQIDLDAEGFAPLLASLRERQASPEQIRVDVEFAWWAAAFDAMIEAEPRLIESGALGAAVERYLELDQVFAQMRSAPLMRAVAEHRRQAIARHPEDARDLFASLMEGVELSMRDVRRDFGAVVAALRPVLIARADQVAHLLPAARCVDVVIVVGAESLATAELVPALARASQVVLVADRHSATRSAVAEIARLLPSVPLRGLPQPRDLRVGVALQHLGYERTLPVVPAPGEAGVDHGLEAVVLDAVAQPIPGRHVVESTRAEVATIVERAMHAAATIPRRSVAIVAGNAVHSARIVDALRERGAEVSERLRVLEAGDATGAAADDVMLALGYARDHRGLAPSEFGIWGTAAGTAALAQALLAARSTFTVVSALDAHHLRAAAMSAPQGNALTAIADLIEASQHPAVPAERATPGSSDWLLADVARLLRARGCGVRLRYGIGGQAIPMVVGGPRDRGYRVAVVTDEPADATLGSLRDRVRWQYRRLETLGWTVVSLWTIDVFTDPVAAAEQVLAALGESDDVVGGEASEVGGEVLESDGDAGHQAASADAEAALTHEEPEGSWLASFMGDEVFADGDVVGVATADEGAVDEGAVDEGAVDEGAVDEGDVEHAEAPAPEPEPAPEAEPAPEPEPEPDPESEPELEPEPQPEPEPAEDPERDTRRTPMRGVDRPLIPTRAWEDEDAAWGDRGGRSREDEIRGDRPPHW